MHFEVFVGRDGQFYLRLKAGNGETVMSSEGYTRLSSAEDSLAAIAKGLATAEDVPVIVSRSGYNEPEIRTLNDYRAR